MYNIREELEKLNDHLTFELEKLRVKKINEEEKKGLITAFAEVQRKILEIIEKDTLDCIIHITNVGQNTVYIGDVLKKSASPKKSKQLHPGESYCFKL